MIHGGTISMRGSFTTCPDCRRRQLVITVVIFGRTFVRSLLLLEIPGFIEFMENNDRFQVFDDVYVTLEDKQKKAFIEDLRHSVKLLMEGCE